MFSPRGILQEILVEALIFLEFNLVNFFSLRDKRQQLTKEDTLDDIFGKGKDSKNIFGKNNDDDLFTTPAAATVDEASALEEDDIMKYINDNLDQGIANLDL